MTSIRDKLRRLEVVWPEERHITRPVLRPEMEVYLQELIETYRDSPPEPGWERRYRAMMQAMKTHPENWARAALEIWEEDKIFLEHSYDDDTTEWTNSRRTS